tara:strand:- start:1326 stop:1922 length:597 start_codon:yes stop_codon:yes gene_type:complete
MNLLKGSFLTKYQLSLIRFKSIGRNVLIDSTVMIPNPENVSIGDNVRIDFNTILSASKNSQIILNNNVHIAPFNLIYAGNNHQIVFHNHSGIAAGCKLFGKTEDYHGEFLMNPTHESEDLRIIEGDIILQKFATLGCNSTVFPNSIIPEGTVFGSHSLYNGKKQLDEWSIYTGTPVSFFKRREKSCKILAEKYNKETK